MIPRHTLLRISAVLGTLVVIFLTGGHTGSPMRWNTFVYVLGFVHYFSALLYSQKQIRQTVHGSLFYVKVAGMLSIASIFLYFRWLPLEYYFGVHHAFNEAYQMDGVTRAKDDPSVRSLRAASALLCLFVYFFLLRHDPKISGIPMWLLTTGLAVSYAVYFYYLWRARRVLSLSELIDNCAAEVVSLIAIGLSFHFTVQFFFIVAYHFVFWGLRPIPRLWETDRARFFRYLGVTGLFFGTAYLVSPMGPKFSSFAGDLFYRQFIFWSYLHITLSFAVSDFHPRRIVRFFRPPQVGSA